MNRTDKNSHFHGLHFRWERLVADNKQIKYSVYHLVTSSMKDRKEDEK